jgi:uncharacterized membrane protein YtjA (UPF0391 family)
MAPCITGEAARKLGCCQSHGSGVISSNGKRRCNMLQWALIFLVVAIIAGLLGFSGIAGAATNIAWVLFLVGLVLAVIFFFFRGRSTTL